MRPVHPDANAAKVRIGAQVRATRLSQHLTLEQLASATGLTKGFLSRIERDDTTPSLPTLVQLCQVLSIPVGALFEEPDIQRVALADAPRINMGGTHVDERLVTPRAVREVQVIRSSLAAHANGGQELYTVSCEREVLHVTQGSVTVSFASHEEHLVAGDTLTFPGQTPHTWRTHDSGAEVIWVLVPATWSGSS